MLKKLSSTAACLVLLLAARRVTATGAPSLTDQILALDKELSVLRKTTVADPAVKAAEAQVQAALNKLKFTEDAVLARTDPKGKELVEKFHKLLAQYKAQQQAAAAKPSPKP